MKSEFDISNTIKKIHAINGLFLRGEKTYSKEAKKKVSFSIRPTINSPLINDAKKKEIVHV